MKEKPKNFQLLKIKVITGGGVEAAFNEAVQEEGVVHNIQTIRKSTKQQHPDLDHALKELAKYLARCYDVNAIEVIRNMEGLTAKQKKAFDDLAPTLDALVLENLKKIEITGFSLSGEEKKQSVVITGKKLQANKSMTALNSPRIKLNNNTFGFEPEVQDIVERVTDEVCAYLFEGKAAQLELMFDESSHSAQKPEEKPKEQKTPTKKTTKKPVAKAKP